MSIGSYQRCTSHDAITFICKLNLRTAIACDIRSAMLANQCSRWCHICAHRHTLATENIKLTTMLYEYAITVQRLLLSCAPHKFALIMHALGLERLDMHVQIRDIGERRAASNGQRATRCNRCCAAPLHRRYADEVKYIQFFSFVYLYLSSYGTKHASSTNNKTANFMYSKSVNGICCGFRDHRHRRITALLQHQNAHNIQSTNRTVSQIAQKCYGRRRKREVCE